WLFDSWIQANGKGAAFRKIAAKEGFKLVCFFAAVRAAHLWANRQRLT
ncbi:unnamed protein product, partial [Ascophyllum nodosum]